MDKVGVNHATTATCFCDVHDDEVFAPIEKGGAPSLTRKAKNTNTFMLIKHLYLSIIKKTSATKRVS